MGTRKSGAEDHCTETLRRTPGKQICTSQIKTRPAEGKLRDHSSEDPEITNSHVAENDETRSKLACERKIEPRRTPGKKNRHVVENDETRRSYLRNESPDVGERDGTAEQH